jgi:hypothetical protein
LFFRDDNRRGGEAEVGLSDDERHRLEQIAAYLTDEDPLFARRMAARVARFTAIRRVRAALPVTVLLTGVAMTVVGADVRVTALSLSGLAVILGYGIYRMLE